MNKLESNLKNLVLSLTSISFFMAALLGFVHSLTKKNIQEAELKKINNAISQVISNFNNNPFQEKIIINKDLEIYIGKKDKEITGYAVKTVSHNGFNGDIVLMVGFSPNLTINNITVIKQNETPGLGSKMSDPKFINQFVNKNPSTFILKPQKDGGDVEAITASTITTRAFCEAIKIAYDTLKNIKIKNYEN